MAKTTPELVDIGGKWYEESVALFRAAYRDDPALKILFAGLSPARFERALRAVCGTLVSVVIRHGLAKCLVRDGRVTSFGLGYPPGTVPPLWAQLAAFLRLLPHTGPRVAWRLFLTTMKAGGYLPKTSNYLYVVMVCADPALPSRGVALYYARWAQELADDHGWGIHCETTNEANVPLWTRLGYEVTGQAEIGGIRHWFMWRAPRAGKL